jgi:hypothetical protein
LGEQALYEAKVAPGDAADGGDGLGVGEVVEAEAQAEASPVAGQDEGDFVVVQRSVLVGEPDSAVELRVCGQSFLDAGHADEEQPEVLAVEAVAEVFQGRRGQAVGFVDDDQFDVLVRGPASRADAVVQVLVDADVDAGGQ